MNRSGTIKKRTVYVYLPSETMVKQWKDAAKKAKISLSKFIIENMENEIHSSEDFISRLDLVRQVEKLKEENERLQKEKKNLSIVVDKLQEDLQAYRLQPFLTRDFEGVREFEQNLVEALRTKGFIRADDVWREVGVSPRDTKALKALKSQLEALEHYGLVKKTREGWRWIK